LGTSPTAAIDEGRVEVLARLLVRYLRPRRLFDLRRSYWLYLVFYVACFVVVLSLSGNQVLGSAVLYFYLLGDLPMAGIAMARAAHLQSKLVEMKLGDDLEAAGYNGEECARAVVDASAPGLPSAAEFMVAAAIFVGTPLLYVPILGQHVSNVGLGDAFVVLVAALGAASLHALMAGMGTAAGLIVGMLRNRDAGAGVELAGLAACIYASIPVSHFIYFGQPKGQPLLVSADFVIFWIALYLRNAFLPDSDEPRQATFLIALMAVVVGVVLPFAGGTVWENLYSLIFWTGLLMRFVFLRLVLGNALFRFAVQRLSRRGDD